MNPSILHVLIEGDNMKSLLLASLVVAAAPAFAQNCESADLILGPSKKTAQACSDLRTWGPSTLKACSGSEAELTVAAGGVYDMKASGTAWVSRMDFQDEDQSSLTTIFTLNLVEKTYSVQEVQTDQRGHVLSQVSCLGKIQLGNK